MTRIWLVLLTVVTAMLVAPTPVQAVTADCNQGADFDGDGRSDLAVGIPNEQVGSINDAGAVHVIYGGSTGLTASGDQLVHQGVSGSTDAAEPFDEFGAALATGDFDGDGFTDVAVGIPFEDVDSIQGAGAVHVFYGSSSGLFGSSNQFIHQDTDGFTDSAEPFDEFGSALTSGDFDGDGLCDLAVGIPEEKFDSNVADDPGAVHIIYGSMSGLTSSGNQLIHQDTPGITDSAEETDEFGTVLTSGDFDDDGRDDLAVGIRLEDVGANAEAGAVHVIYGSSSGLTASGDQLIHQDTSGITDKADVVDFFGTALATGDFDDDGRDDLAVGVTESVDVHGHAGAVHVIYGSSSGLTASGDQLIHQDTSGIADRAESDDEFGNALASGDFDNDGRSDLAVGIPLENVHENLETIENAGAVHVIYGGSSGLSASGDQFIHQDTAGIADSAEDFDSFAEALASGDFDGDGRDDVGVGIRREDVDTPSDDAGAVHVIYGSSSGLSSSGDQFIHQDTSGIAEAAEVGDEFGDSLPGSRKD